MRNARKVVIVASFLFTLFVLNPAVAQESPPTDSAPTSQPTTATVDSQTQVVVSSDGNGSYEITAQGPNTERVIRTQRFSTPHGEHAIRTTTLQTGARMEHALDGPIIKEIEQLILLNGLGREWNEQENGGLADEIFELNGMTYIRSNRAILTYNEAAGFTVVFRLDDPVGSALDQRIEEAIAMTQYRKEGNIVFQFVGVVSLVNGEWRMFPYAGEPCECIAIATDGEATIFTMKGGRKVRFTATADPPFSEVDAPTPK